MPISSSVRKTRMAISPRLATRTFLNMGAEPYVLFSHGASLTERLHGQDRSMSDNARHDHAEAHFRALLDRSGLPQPDEVAHLRRCVVFLWEATRSIVL